MGEARRVADDRYRADLRAALARIFLARLRRPVAANDAPAVEPPGGEKQCG